MVAMRERVASMSPWSDRGWGLRQNLPESRADGVIGAGQLPAEFGPTLAGLSTLDGYEIFHIFRQTFC